MVTSSSVTAASAADGWGGGAAVAFAGVAAGFGGAGTVDASTGIDVRAGAGADAFTGTSAGAGAFTSTSAGGVVVACTDPVPALAKTASGAAIGGGAGVGSRVEIAGAVPALVESDSGGAGVFACGGIGLSVPALGGCGGSIRGWFRRAVNASAGIGVEVDPEGELGAFAWGETGGVTPVFTDTRRGGVRGSPRNAVNASNGLRAGLDSEDEFDAFAATGGAAPVLAGRDSGGLVRGMTGAAAPFLPETAAGGDLSGAAAAGAPSGRRRLAPMAEKRLGINVGAGPRG